MSTAPVAVFAEVVLPWWADTGSGWSPGDDGELYRMVERRFGECVAVAAEQVARPDGAVDVRHLGIDVAPPHLDGALGLDRAAASAMAGDLSAAAELVGRIEAGAGHAAAVGIDMSRPDNHGIPTEDIRVLLSQIVGIDGPDAILTSEPVANSSGRVIGERVTVSGETWQCVAEAWRAMSADAAG